MGKGPVTRGMLIVQECRIEEVLDSESERKFSTSSYPSSANTLSYGRVAATSVFNNEPHTNYHFTEGASYHQLISWALRTLINLHHMQDLCVPVQTLPHHLSIQLFHSLHSVGDSYL